jgi:hypothetical protein
MRETPVQEKLERGEGHEAEVEILSHRQDNAARTKGVPGGVRQ